MNHTAFTTEDLNKISKKAFEWYILFFLFNN